MEHTTTNDRTGAEPLLRLDLLALALILAGTALRLWIVAAGELNLAQDEAQYWDWTRTLQLSYYSKGPLVAYIIRFWTLLLGDTELAVRAGALAGSAALQAVMYLGVSRLFGRPWIALWTLVIAATMPMFIASSVLMTTDNPLLVCWAVALFALYAASEGRWGRWPWRILAVCLALGIWAKYMMLAFLPVAALYSLLARREGLPEGYWRSLARYGACGAVVGLLPILVWNAMNGFAGFHHVTHLGGLEGARAKVLVRFDRFPEYLGSQVGLITPWWFGAMLVGAWCALRPVCRGGEKGIGLDRRPAVLLAAGFWPVWGFFLLWSFHTKVLANWSAVSYATGLILAAAAWDRAWRLGTGLLGRYRKAWLALGVVVFILLHVQARLPLPERANPAMRLMGWASLGQKIGELKETFPDPARVFVFGNNYDITAELSFYVPGRDRAYCVDTGRRMNQYDLWPGPQDKAGWDAIYVVKDIEAEAEPEVKKIFSSVERMEFVSTHLGRPARKFTIFLCRGFTGQWPGSGSKEY